MANTVYLVACSRGTCASTVPTKVLHKFVSSFKILFLCTSYKAMKNIWCHLVIFAVRVFHEQYGHRGGTSSVKWSPSGGFFATAGSDQMIKLWEVHSCKYYWDRLSQDSWSWLVVMLIRGGSEGCIRGAWTPFTWSENLIYGVEWAPMSTDAPSRANLLAMTGALPPTAHLASLVCFTIDRISLKNVALFVYLL